MASGHVNRTQRPNTSLQIDRQIARIRAVAGDGGAAAEPVGVEIDRNDDACAERARRADRHRVDQCAIDQLAPADMNRREDSRHGVGGAQRQR